MADFEVPAIVPSNDTVIKTTEVDPEVQALRAEAPDEGDVVFDPKKSERQYYRDPFAKLQREIWRPGDGDGEKTADYHDKPGPPPSVEKRWRLYQSTTGTGPIKRDVNEPPKYVLLDDKAAYEVFASDIHRSNLAKYWSHDFGGPGKIRTRRPHRGRGAIGNPDAQGEDAFNFGYIGVKGAEKYYFTGEPGYDPIIYADGAEVKSKCSTPSAKALLKELKKNSTAHGHNQFTPKDQLVKYGAPSQSKNQARYKPRINAFLRRDASPEFKYMGKLTGQGQQQPIPGIFGPSATPSGSEGRILADLANADEDSLWMDQDESPNTRRKRKRETAYEPVDPSTVKKRDGDEEMDDFPFARHESTKAVSIGASTSSEKEEKLGKPARKKLTQRQSILEQTLSTKADAEHASSEMMMNFDSGSYASQLEGKLKKAKIVIEEQGAEIRRLEDVHAAALERVEQLEEEVVALKDGARQTVISENEHDDVMEDEHL